MKLLYQTLLTFLLTAFLFANTVQADCCNAGFSSYRLSQSSGLNAFRFQVTDSIAADILYVQWAFGDGAYSNETSPTHLYNYTGRYSVTLTVFKQLIDGVQKSCSETRDLLAEGTCSNFIYFQSNHTVSFIQTASFNIDSASSWAQSRTFLWTFGDGQTSTEFNPTHTYAQAGSYTACIYQYRNDSAFVDSCYTCKSFVIQDTTTQVTCNAVFSHQVTGANVSVYAADSLNPSYWWLQGDTVKQYGSDADYTITSNSGITICHRQYTGVLFDSASSYCEACSTIYSNIPIDTTVKQCHADFAFVNGDTAVAVFSTDSADISRWWIKINGVSQGEIYDGANAFIHLPASGEIEVCHLQYKYSSGAASNDSCFVCSVVRSAQDSIVAPTPVCYSDFDYTINGNMVFVYIDSISRGAHLWKFGNESIRFDSSATSYTFNTSGTKRICQTTIHTNYSTNITDSCTTCKDILLESAEVSIHPNPAVSHVNFKVKYGLVASIAIYNSNGILVKHITDLNTDKYNMNISTLTSGIYYASVVLTDGRINKSTIVIQ